MEGVGNKINIYNKMGEINGIDYPAYMPNRREC